MGCSQSLKSSFAERKTLFSCAGIWCWSCWAVLVILWTWLNLAASYWEWSGRAHLAFSGIIVKLLFSSARTFRLFSFLFFLPSNIIIIIIIAIYVGRKTRFLFSCSQKWLACKTINQPWSGMKNTSLHLTVNFKDLKMGFSSRSVRHFP